MSCERANVARDRQRRVHLDRARSRARARQRRHRRQSGIIAHRLETKEPGIGGLAITPEIVEARRRIGNDPATKVAIRGAATASIAIEGLEGS